MISIFRFDMHNSKIDFFILNTFIGKGLKGNPTPVLLLKEPLPREKMQSIALGFKMPVSVFLIKGLDHEAYDIRFYTSTGEIPTCGHGALGAAFILSQLKVHSHTPRFHTCDDTILSYSYEEATTFIHYPKFKSEETHINQALNKALGVTDFKDYFFCSELESLFIELENEQAVSSINPDFQKLLDSSNSIKEVVIMSESSHEAFDVSLRSFCPWIGIDEDPVTGSIHSVLGDYWGTRLGINEIRVHQSSANGGQLLVKPEGDLVKIGGDCEVLLEGTLKH